MTTQLTTSIAELEQGEEAFGEFRPISAVRIAAGEYLIETKSGVRLWRVEGRSLAEWVCLLVNIAPTLLTELETAQAEHERWRAMNICVTCGGYPLASGRECVCGGKGTMEAERNGLRLAALDAEDEVARLQAERDGLQEAISKALNWHQVTHIRAALESALGNEKVDSLRTALEGKESE